MSLQIIVRVPSSDVRVDKLVDEVLQKHPDEVTCRRAAD